MAVVHADADADIDADVVADAPGVKVLHLPSVEKCFEHDHDFHLGKTTYIVDFIARFHNNCNTQNTENTNVVDFVATHKSMIYHLMVNLEILTVCIILNLY